jgi:hypothetical protein
MSKTVYKKVEGENIFFLSFPPFDLFLFLSHFWPFFCMRSSKTPHKYFSSKNKPENLKNHKTNGGR